MGKTPRKKKPAPKAAPKKRKSPKKTPHKRPATKVAAKRPPKVAAKRKTQKRGARVKRMAQSTIIRRLGGPIGDISIDQPPAGNTDVCSGELENISLNASGGALQRFWAKVFPGPCSEVTEANPWESAPFGEGSASGTGSFNRPAPEGEFCLKVWAVFEGETELKEDQRDYVGECIDGGGE